MADAIILPLLKLQRFTNNWTWITDIKDVSSLGYVKLDGNEQPEDYDVDIIEYIGDDPKKETLLLRVTRINEAILYVCQVRKAYLCNGSTGTTIDSLT